MSQNPFKKPGAEPIPRGSRLPQNQVKQSNGLGYNRVGSVGLLYEVDVELSLLYPKTLTRRWGRIGTHRPRFHPGRFLRKT